MVDFFEEFKRMQKDMDKMFEQISKQMPVPEFKDTHVDVTLKDEKVVVKADMPGIKKEDIDLVVTEDGISIKAERKDIAEEKEEGLYKQERKYKGYSIYRSFPVLVLPATAKAEYQSGVLKVKIERAEKKKEKKGKKIKVA